ncbi:MAG TPA: hypothetical protein PLP14_06840, partial [Chitinophagaceae bacterium]|nr:hypothetical protein [Chitinophagaceae bacterium]
NKDPNNVPKSNAAQKATKPDEPLEEEGEGEDMDEDESKKSSNVSLPFLNCFLIKSPEFFLRCEDRIIFQVTKHFQDYYTMEKQALFYFLKAK